jgi:glutathione S-transferase
MPEETKPRLKLYHASPSRSSVAMWMLEEVGEPYEIQLLSLKNGDQHKPEYLAVNPMGKVPTIDDNGTVVSEVSAICCYLADAYPKAGLAPAVTDKLRGPYLKWLFYAPSCIEPAMIDKAMNRPPVPRSTAGWADYDTVIAVLRDAAGNASPYLLGERFSAADVVIGSSLRWGMQFKLLPELPEFVAYTQRLKQRPALQRQIARDEAFARQTSS